MKRSALVLISIMLILSGCKGMLAPKEIDVTIAGDSIYDSAGSIAVRSESNIWKEENISTHEDETARETVSIEFNGKTYTGRYKESSIVGYNTYQTDRYDTGSVSFSIIHETGELAEPEDPKEVYGAFSIEEGEEIANAIADDYIDADEYVLNTSILDIGTYYYYEKYIDGIKAWDSLTVGISRDGEVIYFCRSGAKGVDANASIERFDDARSQEAGDKIIEKLDAITAKSNKEISYETINKTVVGLEEGEIGIIYTIEIQYRWQTGPNEYCEGGQLVDLLVSEALSE